MEHQIVSRIADGPFGYQAWPTLARAKDGTLFIGASGHRQGHFCPFGKNYLYQSDDNGKTWVGPRILNESYLDNRDVGLLCWGEKEILMCSVTHSPEQYEAWDEGAKKHPHVKIRTPLSLALRQLWETLPPEELERHSFVRISHDNGKTWSERRNAPVFAPHGPVLLPDGGILYVGRKFALDRSNYDILAYVSYDEGKSWEFRSRLPYPEELSDQLLSEPHAIRLKNGEYFVAVRTESTVIKPKSHTLRLFTLRSDDEGRTWKDVRLLELKGAPPHLLQHSSGALILSYSRRIDPMGEYVRVSHDNGHTWSEDVRIGTEPIDWDHGYPTTVELEGGVLLTAYYQKCPGDDFTSLHTVRWTLEEIGQN